MGNILKQFNLLINNSNQLSDHSIVLDLSRTHFLCGELTSFMSLLVLLLQNSGFSLKFRNLKPSIEDVLKRNGFLGLVGLGSPTSNDTKQTTIPIFIGYSQDTDQIFNFLYNQVFSYVQWPNHLNKDHEIDAINSAIYEITRNINEHSGSNRVYMCGQFYPYLRQLRFSIVDNGVSIPTNLRTHISDMSHNSDEDLIDWSTRQGNSTKDTPASGLGLFDIKNNMLDNGELTIVSSKGFWKQTSQGNVIKYPLNSPMPGTMLHLNFYLNGHNRQLQNATINNDDLLF